MNSDPHHGHLDCGTFNLTWQNLSYIGEAPRTDTETCSCPGTTEMSRDRTISQRPGPEMEMIALVNGDYSIVEGRQASLPITEEPRFSWNPY